MTYEEIKVLVDSYNESVNLYKEATKGEIKSTIGKLGLKGTKFVKNMVLPDENDIDTGVLDDPKKKAMAEKLSKIYNKVADKGTDITKKVVDSGIKMKYASDPEKMELMLKENIKKIPQYKEALLTLAVWGSTIPISVGCLDSIIKGLIQAVAMANEDMHLCEAARRANLWIPLAGKTVADTIAKLNKKTIDWNVAKKKFLEIYDKIEKGLGKWANSDQPLFITVKKGPEVKNAKFEKDEEGISAKAKDNFNKKISDTVKNGNTIKTVKEAAEAYVEGYITYDEFEYILESVGFDYDNEY